MGVETNIGQANVKVQVTETTEVQVELNEDQVEAILQKWLSEQENIPKVEWGVAIWEIGTSRLFKGVRFMGKRTNQSK